MKDNIEQSKGSSSDWIHERALSALDGRLAEDKRFLDVGCGTGGFPERVAGKGVRQVHCCDFEKFDERVNKFQFTKVDLNSALAYPGSNFDVVSALEVIEHLENPRHLVRELHRILKPGGTLLLSTPNNESLTSLLSLCLRGYYSAFADSCYPAHITPVLAVDGQRMLREAGFREITLLWSNQGRAPAVPFHWQSLLGPLACGKRFSDNFFLRAVK
ncbi:MAG TPA: class I SAM-dependent methyltransferase [Bdellovibrionota bacterium]|jgi:2-polyprenyl-3-methyl-5-hydroxy-6-metoxy-1,4-benzoquinol methylase